MAAPIVGYEVRYRIAGSGAQWTTRQFPADSTTITIPGLSRAYAYEGEARSLGPNGLNSGWVGVSFTVANAALTPRAPTGLTATSVADGVALAWSVDADQRADVEYSVERATSSGGTYAEIARARLTRWTDPTASATAFWYRIRAVNFAGGASAYSNVANAAGVASSAILQSLSDIASDNVLTPVEKTTVIADYTAITAEQAGIDAQATAYGITTEKTTYDTAVSALTSYLSGLTSPVAWNDTSGNTSIVGTTFRSKFTDVYAARQALLNKIAEVGKGLSDAAQAGADYANLVIDPGFERDASGWSLGTGFSVGNVGNHYAGTKYLVRVGGSGGVAQAQSAAFAVTANETVCAEAMFSNFVLGANGTAYLGIWFYDASDAFVGGGVVTNWTLGVATAVGQYRIVRGQNTAPASATKCRIGAEVSGNTTGFWLFDQFRAWRPDSVVAPEDFVADANGRRRNGLRVANSGHRVGDNRNLPMIMVGNGRAKVPATISYTASAGTPATATISVSAFTILGGDYSTSYSASSVGVSGTGGTTTTYYLYMDDSAQVGGSRTLVATTTGNDLYASSGRLYIGDCAVTFPTSGTGGGGGGRDPACVCVDMLVGERLRADQVQEDTLLDVVDILSDPGRLFQAPALGNRIVDAECVRLVSAEGAVLHLSAETPFDTLDGRSVLAVDMTGEMVVTDRGIDRIVRVEHIGTHPVARISVGGLSFAAGIDSTHRIYSHNTLKP